MTSRIDRTTEQAIRSFVREAGRRFDVRDTILFGSRARHDFDQDSDADLAMILRGRAHRFLDTKLELADIAYSTFLDTGVLIQPLPIWEDEWEDPAAYSEPALLRNIAREGVRL